jgi:hypothetical protein
MAKLNDEHRRVLQLLARSPNGCAEAILMAHGFPMEMLEELTSSGHAKAEAHKMKAGGRPVTVVSLQITAAGREAIG